MEIRNRSTGAVTTVSQFKADHPTTSFPKQITTEILDSYGYDAVLNGPTATVTAPYGISVRDGVEQVDGQWFTKFVAGPVFTDSLDEDGEVVTTAAEHEAAYRANIDSDAATRARARRNSLLADCDWAVLADSPLTTAKKTEWKAYRQALRDISAAEGFPHTMEWPESP
jgi:hypothetical protein|tara:strand:- start:229 stop:735 length:507 start_codon:yes stop_codon:yes gene_type:complete